MKNADYFGILRIFAVGNRVFGSMRTFVIPLLATCVLLSFSACRNDLPDWEKALVEVDGSLADEANISQSHKADLADL